MPSHMIHYCISNEILKLIHLDSAQFTIGNLSPDAHDGSQCGNCAAHFKTAYRQGIDNYPVVDLEGFKDKYLSKDHNDFMLGYYCHLITDNLWSEYVYYECLQCDEVEREKRVERCYTDYYTLNKILSEQYGVCKIDVQLPEELYIEEISMAYLKKVVQEFYYEFNNNYDGDLIILSLAFVNRFMKDAISECLLEMKEYI